MAFSILLRIVRGETSSSVLSLPTIIKLSVSSYGSCGVKPPWMRCFRTLFTSFSILLRIVRGETLSSSTYTSVRVPSFSILLRIVRGETACVPLVLGRKFSFSILLRIVRGETSTDSCPRPQPPSAFSILLRIVRGETY